MWIFIVIITILISYFVAKLIDFFNFWKKRGVAYMTVGAILRNFGDTIFRRRNSAYIIEDLYKLFPHKRYFGIYQFNMPCLVVNDLDLIKRITVRDFDHFVDHPSFFDVELEPLFGKNLLALTGQKWKDMRATLSPTFTGNKIRIMFTLMRECGKQFNEHFLSQKDEIIEFEAKDLMSRCAVDIIATCAFGVECNSVKDKDNLFAVMGRSATKVRFTSWVKVILHVYAPRVTKMLKMSFLPKDVTTYFNNAIRETLRERKEKNIVRPDMIHLLMEAMKESQTDKEPEHVDEGFAAVEDFNQTSHVTVNKKAELTVEDIVAQAFIFFLAGFETVSILLSHCLQELAVNPDIQRKLRAEVDQQIKRHGDDLGYEAIVNMKYLDAVISETLRKWPPAIALTRLCVKDYPIEADDTYGELPLLVEKGTNVMIFLYGIHRNPKYYPNPEKFDPDRFSEENRNKLVPYSYLPFGMGPRNCIGFRFALVEVKTLLTYILSKFEVVPTSKTEIPLKLSPHSNSPCPKGFWLGLKKRDVLDN